MEKYIKKILIIGGSILLCIALGTYAAIIASDSTHYEVSPDQNGICITGPVAPNKYVISYDNPNQSTNLFIPKNTTPEFDSFIDTAITSNTFSVSNVYEYDENDYYGEICGTYANCTYGTTHGQGYDNTSPGCSDWRYCTTPCGEVTCGGTIACVQP